MNSTRYPLPYMVFNLFYKVLTDINLPHEIRQMVKRRAALRSMGAEQIDIQSVLRGKGKYLTWHRKEFASLLWDETSKEITANLKQNQIENLSKPQTQATGTCKNAV